VNGHARVTLGRSGRTMVATVEAPAGPLPRPEVFRLLGGARQVLDGITTPVGGLYRRGLVERIAEAERRERRA
jgi:hypothetical protein